jgi:hypothetical protein
LREDKFGCNPDNEINSAKDSMKKLKYLKNPNTPKLTNRLVSLVPV